MEPQISSYLVLLRHGKSEWNALGLWTGWQNPPLNEEGKQEAEKSAQSIQDIHIDFIFQSDLKRVQETVTIVKKALKMESTSTTTSKDLRERGYGIYEGKNKWEIQKQVGEEEFQKIRRSWDHAVPEGETLKDVYNRVVPFYESQVIPALVQHKNVLVAASGNSLRALVKYLENIPDEQIASLEIGTGEIYVYGLDANGKIVSKELRSSNAQKGKV